MSDPIPPLTATPDSPPPVQFWVVNPPKQRYWLHAVLLLATFFTTLVVGAGLQDNFRHNQPLFSPHGDSLLSFFPIRWTLADPTRLVLGLPFSLTLMLILLAHETGHYIYCKRYGVYATLPFFIPAPTLIGTLGAFIRIRSPIRSRTALFDIGIAGPIAGFIVAIAVLGLSLLLSRPASGAVWSSEIQLGYPRIFYVVHRLIAFLAPGHGVAAASLPQIYLHPTAVAAWVGMLATALNLLPGGQLDGGHIIFALAPRFHKVVSRLTILVLLPLAVYCWAGWLIWGILLEISSFRHPQVADWPRVSGLRRWLALVAFAILVLTFSPRPLAPGSIRELFAGAGR